MKLLAIAFVLALCGCTHSQIMQECKEVQDKDLYVCKTVLPWK